jgi:hypothetical protein
MPWSRAKKLAAAVRADPERTAKELALFDACFRIQREACEAAGHHIPMVVENVRGAQKWVGRARWNFGSFYLWGDVPALMPMTKKMAKMSGHGMNRGDPIWGPHTTGGYDGLKWGEGQCPGNRFDERPSGNIAAHRERTKVPGFRFDGSGKSFQSASVEGTKCGGDWFNAEQPSISRMTSSKSTARKAASAMIARIPFVLARHIAKTWYPA